MLKTVARNYRNLFSRDIEDPDVVSAIRLSPTCRCLQFEPQSQHLLSPVSNAWVRFDRGSPPPARQKSLASALCTQSFAKLSTGSSVDHDPLSLCIIVKSRLQITIIVLRDLPCALGKAGLRRLALPGSGRSNRFQAYLSFSRYKVDRSFLHALDPCEGAFNCRRA